VFGAVARLYPALAPALASASFADERPGGEDAPPWVEPVLREFGWLDPVSLAGASELAGMHPAHFVRAFRKHVGMTPGAYRRRERIRAVSRLLLETQSSLSRIAQDCGFSDQSHLGNVFRESTGISPHRYRRAFAR
jgi:AraC-like DNA-binding protein